ncbi:MAG: hypothetical protein OEQ39_20245 [Gammaproteobacteria bacterium]|nr:hypothetical protein [Gammaproteobacteria bacterium]MDH3464992.1 hypothetical protein [Gammaproteobacteria bacterium]
MTLGTRGQIVFALVALLVAACWAYSPGLSGDFLFDDEANIRQNRALAFDALNLEALWRAANGGFAGPLNRPIAMLSFAIDTGLHGFDPFYFKTTNLAIHIATGLSVWLLVHLLLTQTGVNSRRAQWITIATAAAWTLHPFNLSPVLYVVQRMTSLSALFVCCGVISYVLGRRRLQDDRRAWPYLLIATPLFGTFALLCKESGALLPLLLLVTEYCLFQFKGLDYKSRRLLVAYLVVFASAPFLALGYYYWTHPYSFAGGYSHRDFNAIERLMTESRVIVWYLKMIVFPVTSEMGLQHDDIAISRSIFDPVTTLPAILSIVGAVIAAVALRKRAAVLSFGLLWFLTGHLLESTILPLDIAYEHRNYLPSVGIVFALLYYGLKTWRLELLLPLQTTIVLGTVSILAFTTHIRASDWGDPQRFTLSEVKHHPKSPNNNYFAGMQLLATAARQDSPDESAIALASKYLKTALTLRPAMASATIALLCMNLDFRQTLDQSALIRLQNQLKTHPVTPSTMNSLHFLSSCTARHPNEVSKDIYLSTVSALIENSGLIGYKRSLVLAQIADHAGQHFGDFDLAVNYADSAIKTSPSQSKYYLLKAKWYIYGKDYSRAIIEIDNAARIDTHHRYQLEIRQLRAAAQTLSQNRSTITKPDPTD